MVTLRTNVTLLRVEENVRFGTFGTLLIDGQAFCNTLEPADEENARFRSSIPAQQYHCLRVNTHKYGTTFQVMDVPGRTDIFFHKGNLIIDTEGCICLGSSFGKLGAERAILNSGRTFNSFLQLLKDRIGFHLTIREIY